jgi:hypothetical protein
MISLRLWRYKTDDALFSITNNHFYETELGGEGSIMYMGAKKKLPKTMHFPVKLSRICHSPRILPILPCLGNQENTLLGIGLRLI